ncbi:MAG: primosomal protein N' [Chloroflexi bacterium]|nr:primosomal protein N' [Chloroflexota bacterium]
MHPAEEGEPDKGAGYAIVAVAAGPARPARAREIENRDEDTEDRPLGAFHYHIPPELAGLEPGHLVWVWFGPQYLPGVVMALSDESPVADTRPIDRLADPQPVLTATQLSLARWISQHYLASLQQVIWAMIPPGSTEQAEALLEIAPEACPQDLDQLTPGQREIYEIVRERGPIRLEQVGRHTSLRTWRSMALALERAGIVARRMVISPPKVRPRRADFFRLSPDAHAEELDAVTHVRRRAALATLARWTADRGDTQGWMAWDALSQESRAVRADVRWLLGRGWVERERRQVWRDPLADSSFVPVTPPELTDDQQRIWLKLRNGLSVSDGVAYLLQGVTGSGKTELYLRAAQRVLEQGRGAIILVPEIALTPQTIRRFGARFPDSIAVVHSGLTPGERFDQWRRIRSGELRLVVGARSAIFSPVQNLGLIVLDEEHEWTYKQDSVPRYHARQVALELRRLTGATVILGSATPSLESAYLAERGELVHLSLPNRVMGHRRTVQQAAVPAGSAKAFLPVSEGAGDALYAELPPVQVVDLRRELREGNTSIFSRDLQAALNEVIAAGQQAILFVNRRGAASFVMCRDCGQVLNCDRCGLPLTYHSAGEDLVCHRCNVREPVPEVCPRCASRRIRYFGLGTQRVEDDLRSRYPGARVVRWDYDATRGHNAHEQLLDLFTRGEADIMVGTQMVAKGLDLPLVTLVGVISADTLINLPDLRASERTFQLLTQVAGRAGRSVLGGKVIIQTYAPEHPAIVAASTHDYEQFYRQEIAFRRAQWYPPVSRMVRLLYTGPSAESAQEAAKDLHNLLAERIARLGLPDVDLLGPAPAFYQRLRGHWRWQILVRGAEPAELVRDVALPSGWRVDVDPLSLL